MHGQKKVAAIHDLSGYGRCSLTVVLPILSAAGIQCSCLPTAILSTHTGGFVDYTYRDLTEDMRPFMAHWEKIGLTFDALYSGFLGSFEQIDIVSDFFDAFKTKENLILVDPVMGDRGELYQTYTPKMAEGIKQLCKKADIIVPNMTEASFLLGIEYREGPYDKEYVEDILKRLSELGPRQVVLTGVWKDWPRIGAAAYDRDSGEVYFDSSARREGFFHGTGDVFASVLLAALLSGKNLKEAIRKAVAFTCDAIHRTALVSEDPRCGVNFEAGLSEIVELWKTE